MRNYDYKLSEAQLQLANISDFMSDRDYVERQKAFFKVKYELDRRSVKWALICSFSLFLTGIHDDFHDFDILVDANDFDVVTAIFNNLGAEIVDISSTDLFRSDRYTHYRLDGVDFDVIAGFRICSFGTSYHYCYSKQSVKVVNLPYVGNLPIVAMEVQFLLYAMMEGGQPRRKYKRVLIQKHLANCGLRRELMVSVLSDDMPEWIIRTIGPLPTRGRKMLTC